jgi:DNA-directed RNA polymerase subunit H (RpoH/RPB5)
MSCLKSRLRLVQGGKGEQEKILVQKLKAKIIDADEINELINKLKIRQGHLFRIK